MFKTILTRINQGYRTIKYPDGPAPPLPVRFRGRPKIHDSKCDSACTKCMDVCPTSALSKVDGKLQLDMGVCLFCGKCTAACPNEALEFTRDHRLACARREELIITGDSKEPVYTPQRELPAFFNKSFKMRQVSAAGCNACEADCNVLTTVGWDIGRFGLQFVASPRHSDGLAITGPVSENMRSALLTTYEAVPHPKLVLLVGSCAISGGVFKDHPETHNGAENLLPIDLYIPGCPPHPLTILDGLLKIIQRIK